MLLLSYVDVHAHVTWELTWECVHVAGGGLHVVGEVKTFCCMVLGPGPGAWNHQCKGENAALEGVCTDK